jgi:hypothetical protein
MKHQYCELVIYIAGDDEAGSDHIKLSTNALDGSRNAVELKVGEDEDCKSLGFFNVDQLIRALMTIRDCGFKYHGEENKD